MRYGSADGHVSKNTIAKRRRQDQAFLARCMAATAETVDELELNHAGKNVPQWKRVAIARARARIEAES